MARINYQGGGEGLVYQHFQNALNVLQKNDALRQQKLATERKEAEKLSLDLSKDLAKINSSGIRDVDLPEFNKALETAREKFFELNRASGREERMAKSLELNEYLAEAIRIKDLSKATASRLNKAETSLPNMIGKGEWRKASEYLKSVRDKPSTQLGESELDLTKFYYTYDPNKVTKSMDNLGKKLLRDGGSTEFTSEVIGTLPTSGGRRYDYVNATTSVREDKILEEVSNLAKTDREVGNYVESLVEQGMDYNDAIAKVVQDNYTSFISQKQERVSADRPSRGGLTIINSPLPEDVLGAQKSLKLGTYETDKAWTYNKDIGLQGEIDMYDPETGNVVARSRSSFDFKGYNIAILPVDRYGNPIPEGSQRKAEGEGTFLTGRVVSPEGELPEGVIESRIENILKKDVIIPYNELDVVGMSKAQRGTVSGINELSRRPQNRTTESKGSPAKVKKLDW